MKRTPLFELYEKHGAKIVDFHGWEMPVQFSKIQEEHEAVRTKAGLFDVSHMGEVTAKGEGALAFLQYLVTNDVSKLQPGKAQYTAMCYEDGGTVDDLIIYQKAENDYLLVINSANSDSDFEWISSHTEGFDVVVDNISDQKAQLAIQGPKAEAILQTLTDTDLSEIKFFKFKDHVDIAGIRSLVSRTGYTGEDGFEIYCDSADAADLWETIIKAGEPEGLLPCGLGARDTLRFEAKLPLYGQELSPEITPVEAGIGFAVKTDKEADFLGKSVLKQQKEEGAPRKLVGLEMIEKGIPRPDYEVFSDEEKIGHVTTGTQSPTLKKNVGLALLKREYTELGTEVEVQVRKKRLKAEVVKTPFYKR
ncbi:MAG TPA: glycine cleavage system aminomethyltransferase GcvT [Bacillales bacterium]|nr:glycine cleavage system aminomethyltransferase GcvT [Bacillales bacterium]